MRAVSSKKASKDMGLDTVDEDMAMEKAMASYCRIPGRLRYYFKELPRYPELLFFASTTLRLEGCSACRGYRGTRFGGNGGNQNSYSYVPQVQLDCN